MIHHRLTFVVALRAGAVLIGLGACAERQTQAPASSPEAPDPGTQPANATVVANGAGGTDLSSQSVKARFLAAPGVPVKGDVQLIPLTDGVRIHVQVSGSAPGEKGIHIHQTTDCSDIPNKSMGGHFNPQVSQHGLPSASHHHLGDLGNILINEAGQGSLDIVVPGANLRPDDPASFIGRSVVLHEGTDKGTGESGDSGHPVACAPIQL